MVRFKSYPAAETVTWALSPDCDGQLTDLPVSDDVNITSHVMKVINIIHNCSIKKQNDTLN